MTTSAECSLAFSAGADARLAGKSLACNPYQPTTQQTLRREWVEGWRSANGEWGVHVRGRWPVQALPLITDRPRGQRVVAAAPWSEAELAALWEEWERLRGEGMKKEAIYARLAVSSGRTADTVGRAIRRLRKERGE